MNSNYMWNNLINGMLILLIEILSQLKSKDLIIEYNKKMKKVLLSLLLIALVTSCNEHCKVKKSNLVVDDVDYS